MKKNLNTRQEKAAFPESRQAFKKFNELSQFKLQVLSNLFSLVD